MRSGPGLCVVYTEGASYNAGRSYCFQVLTPIRLGDSQGSPGSPRSKAHADANGCCTLPESGPREGTATIAPRNQFAERFPATNPAFACQWKSVQQKVSLKSGKSLCLTTFQPVKSDVSVRETVEREDLGIWAEELLKALAELRAIAKQEQMERSLTLFQRSRVYGRTGEQYMSALYNTVTAAQLTT
jgi:hypothetical protein